MAHVDVVTEALAKVAEWGDEATLRARIRRLDRQKWALTFLLPALCLLAVGALVYAMMGPAPAFDPQQAGFAVFLLLVLAGGSLLMGMGHEGGWRWSHMSQRWKGSGNWDVTMRSPGARTVYAAILAQCEEACYMHLYLLEKVSQVELDAGVFDFNPYSPRKQAYIEVTYPDGLTFVCDPMDLSDRVAGVEGYTTKVVIMSKPEFEALPPSAG